MKAALNKMKTTPGYTSEDAINERIAFIEYQIWTESTTLQVEKKLLVEITDLEQLLEDMNSDIVATEAEELEHVDPEQVAEKEQAASQEETDANLAKQAAVSKKKAALREAAAAEEQQKIAVKALEHQAEVKAEIHVKKKTLDRCREQDPATQVDRFGQGHVSD